MESKKVWCTPKLNDGKEFLLIGRWNKKLIKWPITDVVQYIYLSYYFYQIHLLLYSSDFLVSASYDGTLCIHNLVSYNLTQMFTCPLKQASYHLP